MFIFLSLENYLPSNYFTITKSNKRKYKTKVQVAKRVSSENLI